jgi:DNA-binding MarR family transcriptional regulator
VPRLDAQRVSLFRALDERAAAVVRAVDAGLTEEHGIPLAWYDVLTVIREAGGSMRVHALCAALGELPSSLSRRLDRMEDDELIERSDAPTAADRRAVRVASTAEGRAVWRDANITYRRLVQQHFASHLTESDVVALQRVFGKLGSVTA